MPEAPAPTTTRREGSSSNAHASSVPMTRPPNCVPGIGRATDPVAMMILPALCSSPPTRTVPPPPSDASPSRTSIPFFLKRPPTPPVRVSTTFRRRSVTAPKSTSGSATLMPNSSASRTSERMSAVRSTAFAGMQA